MEELGLSKKRTKFAEDVNDEVSTKSFVAFQKKRNARRVACYLHARVGDTFEVALCGADRLEVDSQLLKKGEK